MSRTRFAGLDGCASGWVCVVLDERGFVSSSLYSDFASAMGGLSSVAAIGVDMPLGLVEIGDREADRAARAYLKGQASSVFSAPPRPVVGAASYPEALEIARRVNGKGLSKQSFNIVPKMIEVDAFVGDERLHEVHPEVSFRILNGDEKLSRKKSWGGVAARLKLLRSAAIELPDDLGEAGDAGVDDVLDAAVAAWSARRIARRKARSYPDESDQVDRSGRVIRILG